MKYHALLVEFREQLAVVSRETETSLAMGHLDIAHICENLFCEVFRALLGWQELRNLNTAERKNFPAIDLADDVNRVAVQVTARADMRKIRATLEGFLENGFDDRYDRLVVYTLTRRSARYNQEAVNRLVGGRMRFNVMRDVMDYRSLAGHASTAKPACVQQALHSLRAYLYGATNGSLDGELDPPCQPAETLTPNLLRVFFPNTLFLAHLLPLATATKNRRGVRRALAARGLRAPSDYEARGGQIVTFRDLGEPDNPFVTVVDAGTVTAITPAEFYAVDRDHENIFRSLLRLLLQQRLYQRGVVWDHEHGLFVFHPLAFTDNTRRIPWQPEGDGVWKTRTVFERKMKRRDPTQVFSVRHLAFLPQFLRIGDSWYLSITPEWFFSYGSGFRRSGFAEKQIAALKRVERETAVRNHFRFWAYWLQKSEERTMFTAEEGPVLTYGEAPRLAGARCLNEEDWERPRDVDLDSIESASQLRLE